jgi:hypothetical protein
MSWDCTFRKSSRKKIKKSEQELVYKYLEERLIALDEDIKPKFECLRSFLKELCGVDDLDNTSISLGWVSPETLIFLFTSLLLDYETTFQNSRKYLKYDSLKDIPPHMFKKVEERLGKLRIIEKDTLCRGVQLEKIFNIGELSENEVKFVNDILTKINVELAYDAAFLLSAKELIILIIGIMRECNKSTGKTSENQSSD